MSFVSFQLIFKIALVQYFIIFSDEKLAKTSLIALTPLGLLRLIVSWLDCIHNLRFITLNIISIAANCGQ